MPSDPQYSPFVPDREQMSIRVGQSQVEIGSLEKNWAVLVAKIEDLGLNLQRGQRTEIIGAKVGYQGIVPPTPVDHRAGFLG